VAGATVINDVSGLARPRHGTPHRTNRHGARDHAHPRRAEAREPP
jgi:hypothetical protein